MLVSARAGHLRPPNPQANSEVLQFFVKQAKGFAVFPHFGLPFLASHVLLRFLHKRQARLLHDVPQLTDGLGSHLNGIRGFLKSCYPRQVFLPRGA